MKTIIVVTVIAIILIVIFTSFTLMSANKTEEQKYTVILKDKDFEIRFYPSATVATINSNAKNLQRFVRIRVSYISRLYFWRQ